jgi:hypothetical protein
MAPCPVLRESLEKAARTVGARGVRLFAANKLGGARMGGFYA